MPPELLFGFGVNPPLFLTFLIFKLVVGENIYGLYREFWFVRGLHVFDAILFCTYTRRYDTLIDLALKAVSY